MTAPYDPTLPPPPPPRSPDPNVTQDFPAAPPTAFHGWGTPPPQKPRRKWRRVALYCGLGVIGFFVLMAVIGAVLGGGKPAVRVAPLPKAVTGSASAPSGQPAVPGASAPASSASPAQDLTGPLGTAFTDSGQDDNGHAYSYDVTAVRVLDPASGSDQYTTPDAGKRFVGVEFKITGDSGYSSDDVNNDAVLLGSNGQTYTSDFSSLAAGTNFNSGDFGVTRGQTQYGWVTFQVPYGVRVSSVQWHPGFDTQPATWDLSSS